MKQYVLSSAAAIVCAGTLGTTQAVVDRPGRMRAQLASSAGAGVQQGALTELVGCLYRERDIPGRPANAVGYTLTNAAPPEGLLRSDESRLRSNPAAGVAPVPLEKSVPGSGGNKMYIVDKIAEERLTPRCLRNVSRLPDASAWNQI